MRKKLYKNPVFLAKATWNWVRGKCECEEAMREVLGAGRGVQAGEVEIPAMAAWAGRETRQGAASDEERRMRRGTRLQHNITY
jgi:hypothetical protein